MSVLTSSKGKAEVVEVEITKTSANADTRAQTETLFNQELVIIVRFLSWS